MRRNQPTERHLDLPKFRGCIVITQLFMDQFRSHDKLIHNARFPNFESVIIHKNTTDMVKLSQGLSYYIAKFGSFTLGASAIVNQKACSYAVTTMNIGL